MLLAASAQAFQPMGPGAAVGVGPELAGELLPGAVGDAVLGPAIAADARAAWQFVVARADRAGEVFSVALFAAAHAGTAGPVGQGARAGKDADGDIASPLSGRKKHSLSPGYCRVRWQLTCSGGTAHAEDTS